MKEDIEKIRETAGPTETTRCLSKMSQRRADILRLQDVVLVCWHDTITLQAAHPRSFWGGKMLRSCLQMFWWILTSRWITLTWQIHNPVLSDLLLKGRTHAWLDSLRWEWVCLTAPWLRLKSLIHNSVWKSIIQLTVERAADYCLGQSLRGSLCFSVTADRWSLQHRRRTFLFHCGKIHCDRCFAGISFSNWMTDTWMFSEFKEKDSGDKRNTKTCVIKKHLDDPPNFLTFC